MSLIFEKSRPGQGCSIISECDVPIYNLGSEMMRQLPLRLPELSEGEISRHYSGLAKKAYGVKDGFYPLGSCTMKYNPRINEEIASLPEFTDIHPLQPLFLAQGCLEILSLAEQYLTEITGMDQMTFQPAAGAHGEFTGLLMIKAYHQGRGDAKRTKIIVPDSAHGTNPASAVMAGFEVITVPSTSQGMVDISKLEEVVGEDTAGLMLTNPNTVGLFDKNILQITEIIHQAGGLNYYDGANLNAIMGKARPGDMGFDVIHLNLHKTFSTPHGGGGPGGGPVGCKNLLADFLPGARIKQAAVNSTDPVEVNLNKVGTDLQFAKQATTSIGRVKAFYGNFLVVVKALTYILTLGRQGIPEAAENAVLNANYLKSKIEDLYPVAYGNNCMHEFVITLEELKKATGVSALDIAKGLLDQKIHPPTMYFPLIVHEALMLEPTETESRETLDQAANVFRSLYQMAQESPEQLHNSPHSTSVLRLDEVGAARHPILRWAGHGY